MKRKKPKIYLTPDKKAYYDHQLSNSRDFINALAGEDPGASADRMIPFVDRINSLECMHVIWWRFPTLVGTPSSLTHSSSMTVAMAKGVEAQLKDVVITIGDAISDADMSVSAAALGASGYSMPSRLSDNVSVLFDIHPTASELDVVMDRNKYFGIEHVTIEIMMSPDCEVDMFQRLDRFVIAWERLTQGFEFAGESWMLTNQP